MGAPTSVRAWVFDLGGVLVRFDDTALRAVLRPEIDAAAWWRFVTGSPAYRGFEAGTASLRDVAVAGRALCRQGVGDGAFVDALRDWASRNYEGAHDTLAVARETGRPVVLLSNTNPLHWGHLRQSFGPCFDSLFLSYRMGALKPDPAVYAAVERGLAVPPEGICFFDDNAHNVAAARARGWRAHQVDGPRVVGPVIAAGG